MIRNEIIDIYWSFSDENGNFAPGRVRTHATLSELHAMLQYKFSDDPLYFKG